MTIEMIDIDKLDEMNLLTAEDRELIPKLIKQTDALLNSVEDKKFRQVLVADLEYFKALLNRRPLREELHDLGYAIKPVA